MPEIKDIDFSSHLVHAVMNQVCSLEHIFPQNIACTLARIFVNRVSWRIPDTADGNKQTCFPGERVIEGIFCDEQNLIVDLPPRRS